MGKGLSPEAFRALSVLCSPCLSIASSQYFGKITRNTSSVVKMQRALWPHSDTT